MNYDDPSKYSSWWRRLEDVFRLRLQKTSSRRFDQDEYIRLSLTSSEDVFKTSSRRLGQDQYIRLGYTSSRRLQDVFKTSSRRLAKTSSRHLQDVFKTFWRRLQNVFKTSWKTSSRHLQDVFKTYHQVKLFLLTRLWEAFNTFLRRSFPKTVIYSRGICLGNTTSDKFMVSVQNLQEIKISQVLVFHFSTPFRGCLERRI